MPLAPARVTRHAVAVPKARKFPRHRPFEDLPKRARANPRADAGPGNEETKSELTFARAAAELGVETLRAATKRVGAEAARVVPSVAPDPEFVVSEEEGWVEGYRRELGPRVLARVRGTPRATLDLHGSRVESARRRLGEFLARAPYSGVAIVLIVVGKGRHSPGGRAVLAREVGSWLSTGSAGRRVLAFRTAPPELGGSGGVLVLLKGTAESAS
jgi:DNA-nicking Smr family endonuclease